MFIKQTSLFLAASLLLAGCSSISLQSPKDQYAGAFIPTVEAELALAKKEVCCENFSQLTYQEISDDEPLFIPITNDSQVYLFATGKSFVQAYKLTTKGSKIKLQVSALISDTVIVPQIMLLDANFKITRMINSDKFTYTEAKLLTGDVLSSDLTIYRSQKNNSKNETYLLFYTTDQAKKSTTTITHPAKSFAKAHNTVEPNIADPIIPHSAMGVIELEIEGQGSDGDNENSYVPENMQTETINKQVTSELNITTEVKFNQEIIEAITANELDKALKIVEKAEKVGSRTARATFINALKK